MTMEKESIFRLGAQEKESTLSEKVSQQIRDLIRERNIQVGDKLPSEFELAESLHVGRGTIREAVKLLVARNFLEIRRGKGTYVTPDPGRTNDPLGFEYVTDKVKLAEELYGLRYRLEPWIAALAAENITEEEKTELRHRCAAVENAILSGFDHGDEDKAFHQFIAQCTHNSVLPEMMPIITYSVHLFTRFKDPQMLKTTIIAHQNVTDAICANDPKAAEESMATHIHNNLDSILMVKEHAARRNREE